MEATAGDLFVHQMIGILPDRAKEIYGIPEDFLPLTALAIGYRGESADLPEHLRERDLAPRTRKPLSQLVFSGSWATPSP